MERGAEGSSREKEGMPNEATHPGASDMVLTLPSGVSGPTKAQFYPKATIKSLSPNPAETSTHPIAAPTGPGN